MHARELEGLSRRELIEKAEGLGVGKADLLTRAELADEIVRRTVADPIERRIARGLLGIARDLVARVVERGLHLPDAAARIRGSERPSWMPVKPPIATVTLAEIYAAQGHRARALSVLDELLKSESDHAAARTLRDEIAAAATDEPAPLDQPESGEPSEPELSVAEPAPAPEPSSPEPSEPPEPYPVDQIVLSSVDPTTVFVRWEIRRTSADAARKRASHGAMVVRLVVVGASWDGPVIETRETGIRELGGDWIVRDLPVGAVVRAAVGWSAGGRFDPLGVAMAVTDPPDRRAHATSSSSWPGMSLSPAVEA